MLRHNSIHVRQMANRTEKVDQFIKQLGHPLEREIELLRSVILNSSKEVTELIKWNAPSFCYKGQDRITFKLYPQTRIQLIFHLGAKVKDSKGFRFEDSTGLLQWLGDDRATIKFNDMNDISSKKEALAKVVKQWLERAG